MNTFLLSLLLFQSMPVTNWQIDQEASVVRFEISNFGLNTVEGKIGGMTGTVSFSPETASQSMFDVTVDVATIDTGIKGRDEHLRKEDYFYVENHPTIRFQSKSVKQVGEGKFETVGTLTIRGVAKEVVMPFSARKMENGFILEGSFTMLRKDFGVGGKSTFSVGNEVAITVICRLVEEVSK